MSSSSSCSQQYNHLSTAVIKKSFYCFAIDPIKVNMHYSCCLRECFLFLHPSPIWYCIVFCYCSTTVQLLALSMFHVQTWHPEAKRSASLFRLHKQRSFCIGPLHLKVMTTLCPGPSVLLFIKILTNSLISYPKVIKNVSVVLCAVHIEETTFV